MLLTGTESEEYDVNKVEFEWKFPEDVDYNDETIVDYENGTLCIKSVQVRILILLDGVMGRGACEWMVFSIIDK